MKIGFIGGGNMAEAIIAGMAKESFIPSDIYVSEIKEERLSYLKDKFNINEAGEDFFETVSIVVLAVKPQVLFDLMEDIKDDINEKHLVVSIVAGIPSEKICKKLSTGHVIRAMPNTPSLIGKGVTVLCQSSDEITSDKIEAVENIFGSVGCFKWIDEDYFDAVSAISGCGPAYVYRFIEAMTDSAVSLGVQRELAQSLVVDTIIGGSSMVKETGEHPRVLLDKVTSPGGTTIQGLQAMEKEGFSSAVDEGIKKAYARSIDLSRGGE